MRKRLILPPSVESTVCPLVSNTRKVAFGSTSLTCPSSCIGSSLAMSPRLAVQRLCSALAGRTALAPSRGSRLELPGLARLHIMPLLAEILQNAGLGDAPFEHFECPIQTVTLFDLDLDHELLSSANAEQRKCLGAARPLGRPRRVLAPYAREKRI